MSIDINLSDRDPENALRKEWLIANGIGGYASNTIFSIPTRKYHGLLIAALPFFGRTVMVNHLLEVVILPDKTEIFLGGIERPEAALPKDWFSPLESFYLEKGLPVWRYNLNGIILEKRVVLTHMQNTVHVIYNLLSGAETLQFKLFPFFNLRATSEPLDHGLEPYSFSIYKNQYEIHSNKYPPVKMMLGGENTSLTLDDQIINDVLFRKEAKRGYHSLTQLWSPGFFFLNLDKEKRGSFTASTESWESIYSMAPYNVLQAEAIRRDVLLKRADIQSKTTLIPYLVLAADQFIISPTSRIQDKTRANAAGDEIRTIIAGYHWFTDWGRDTMISLEGLTLCTGRYEEARWILRTFAYYIKNGLIPNMFPEGENEGLYHTADATLWFFHALHRYLEVADDRETLQFILPRLIEIYEAHLKGTLFGIRVDPQDGLLMQGKEGYQLTWMDAKVDDWVVTPRRGKAVEINALWYNALKLLEKWLDEENRGELARQVQQHAEKVAVSFNQKFWNEKKGCLYDVVEGENGNDDALRPNQLFSISLDYPVADPKYWKAILDSSTKHLLGPIGLRSLSPEHPDYKARYSGDLRARDAAYHQGTIWSWLIGPYVDASLKVYPEKKPELYKLLNDFQSHFTDAGVGYISEIFDASEPYGAKGCIAQAWSIAELLRSLLKTKP